MGEERWDELGVSRRGFLKRLVGGAFVAPIVVSFGLDGVASAATQGHSFPNQPSQHFPNQAHGPPGGFPPL
jgi:hypothetical protein